MFKGVSKVTSADGPEDGTRFECGCAGRTCRCQRSGVEAPDAVDECDDPWESCRDDDLSSCAETITTCSRRGHACTCDQRPTSASLAPRGPAAAGGPSSPSPAAGRRVYLARLMSLMDERSAEKDESPSSPFLCECDEAVGGDASGRARLPLPQDLRVNDDGRGRRGGGERPDETLARDGRRRFLPSRHPEAPGSALQSSSPKRRKGLSLGRESGRKRRKSPQVNVNYKEPIVDRAMAKAGKSGAGGSSGRGGRGSPSKELPRDLGRDYLSGEEAKQRRSAQDREVFDRLGVEGLVREDRPFDHEDCVETYGETILKHFRKEELEREYQLRDKPSLLTGKMKFLVIINEVIIVALFALFMHWIIVVRKANFDLLDVLDVVSKTRRDKEINAKKLDIHMTIYVVIFVLLLPHVTIISVVFGFVNTNRLTAVTFALKLLSFCLFFGGLVDIQAAVSESDESEATRDYKTHLCFSQGAVFVFVMYMVMTSVKLAGTIFRQIFHIRILGSLFRIVVSDWFTDSVDHLTYGAGYMSLLTGISAYLFLSRNDEHFQLLELDDEAVNDEGWHIRAICMLLAVLYIMMLLTNFHKHYIKNHKAFITVDTFKNVFLQFRDLYQEENLMEMGQDMPKVTSAQRML